MTVHLRATQLLSFRCSLPCMYDLHADGLFQHPSWQRVLGIVQCLE